MREIKCINCGAPLHGDTCEYCGSHYENKKFSCDIEDYQGTIVIGGNSYNVYVGEVDTYLVGGESYRNADGIIMRESPKPKHKFTLVEM